MAKLIQNYKNYYFIPDGSNEIHDSIPDGSFEVKYDNLRKQFYIYKSEQASIPSKVYGGQEKIAEKIIKTFNHKTANCGVLLTGTKGTGKTMLSKLISNKANIPTLIVNENFASEDFAADFTTFIQDINQKCIIIFDEFEKNYDDKDQERLLTLLDGLSNSNKLFIFTANKEHKICEFLLNRPGRILFHIRYEKLDLESTKQYCEENLDNKEFIKEILEIRDDIKDFNFDIMKSLVDYCNLHNEKPNDAIKILNVGDYNRFFFVDYEIVKDGKKYKGTSGPHYSNEDFWIHHEIKDEKKQSKPQIPTNEDNEEDDEDIEVWCSERNIMDVKDGWSYYSYNGYNYKVRKTKRKIALDF